MTLRRRLALALLAFLALVTIGSTSPLIADGQGPDFFKRPGPFPVGVRTVVLVDDSRDDPFTKGKRTLVTDIWYPAGDSARGKPTTKFAEFFGPHREAAERVLKVPFSEIDKRFETLAVRDAELRKPDRASGFMLLIFSHGNGGFRHQNVFQMDHLASHGYIVATPDHTGNSQLAPFPDRPVYYDRKGRERSAENRPRDVSFLLDWFTARRDDKKSWLHDAVDVSRPGVFGHSFGGFTACRVAADDKRVKAILPMTVAVAGLSTRPATVPTMVMIGKQDRTVRALGNVASRGYYYSCKAPKYLLTLPRGGHFTFCEMSVLDPNFGDGIGRGKGLDDAIMDFVPVATAKELINAYTLAFFDRHLRASEDAGRFLAKNHYPEELEYKSANTTPSED